MNTEPSALMVAEELRRKGRTMLASLVELTYVELMKALTFTPDGCGCGDDTTFNPLCPLHRSMQS